MALSSRWTWPEADRIQLALAQAGDNSAPSAPAITASSIPLEGSPVSCPGNTDTSVLDTQPAAGTYLVSGAVQIDNGASGTGARVGVQLQATGLSVPLAAASSNLAGSSSFTSGGLDSVEEMLVGPVPWTTDGSKHLSLHVIPSADVVVDPQDAEGAIDGTATYITLLKIA